MTGQMLLAGPLLALMTAYGVFSAGARQTRDESAIREVQARQQDAWNRHDAKAYAALFADDGDVVNVVGCWWQIATLQNTNSLPETPLSARSR